MCLAELNFYCFEYIKLVEVITRQRGEKAAQITGHCCIPPFHTKQARSVLIF